MKKIMLTASLVIVLALAVAAPAFATSATGAGAAYGQHISTMAQGTDGLSATMNPGVMHQGFSGWTGM